MITCGNPKCKQEAMLHHIHVTIDGKLWRIPVYLCHKDECLVKMGAVLVFNNTELTEVNKRRPGEWLLTTRLER